jgi:sialate O-acetylesterase
VVVDFRDVTGALVAYNGAPSGFELCGATQGSCRVAPASLRGNTVVLEGSAERVRYCWGDSPVCSLSDASGLPAGPFEIAVAPQAIP